MLEGLAAWVLNNYLGKYVHLNADQLSIALLSGKVELENLPLKNDAFRHLGLPVQIQVGFIGKVQLQVPVRQIRSAPWVIVIEQLYLVASPLPVDEWDSEQEQLTRHELKLSSLDNVEAKWRLEKDIQDTNSSYYASSYSSWYSYGAGLVSEIIENLQMKIQDVHIRYEDNVSVPGKAIAFGITIDSLTAQSCDSNWLLGFTQVGKSDHSYKLMELQNFSVYWMTLNTNDLLSGLSVAELAEAMGQSKTKKCIKNYIIPSVSCTAHIKRNRSIQPLRSTNMPRITFDLSFEEVPLTLIDWQYNQIVTCIRGLDSVARMRSYRQYKPSATVKEDPFAWWCYAISCFYPGKQPAICRPKPTWESALYRAQQNIQYVQVYKKLLLTPSIALNTTEKNIKELTEWERDYDELKVLREVAMSSVILPDREGVSKSSRGRSMLESWFPQWMGWYSSTPTESDTSSSEVKQLEGEILQVLEDSADNNTILKRDAVFGQFNFCLKKGVLSLCTEQVEEIAPMLELQFKNLSLNILSKPRTSSYLVELSLGALYLRDKTTQNSLFPVLIGPPGQDRTAMSRGKSYNSRLGTITNESTSDESGDNLFFLAYEKKPQNIACDRRLSVTSKCLDVVYHPEAIKWLTNFVCLPHQRDITQSKIEAMKLKTKKEFIKNWEQILEGRVLARTTWELKLDISAPQIIFVEDFTNQNSAMAVIDFGRLQLCNNFISSDCLSKSEFITKESEEDDMFMTPCSTPPASEASSSGELTREPNTEMENIMDAKLSETTLHNKLYDRYSLELTDMQVLIGKTKENWRYALNKGSSTLHILDRFSILLQIERRIVYTSDPLYPSLTLNANLPKLNMHLNENKIISARNLLYLVTSTGLPSPFQGPENIVEEPDKSLHSSYESINIDTSIEMSRILMMQFTIDQMSLEIQSRGRCIAELQVSGVKVAFTKRSVDTSITLSVHSLLLADALQTFGHDFELLIASHKHVGMDSISGSLRDSEPTSPLSPASPDPNVHRGGATSPLALSQALSTLATSPQPQHSIALKGGLFDSEALITIEIVLVSGNYPLQIANIQFNNLDIIANQETIVELVGFVRRVFPKSYKQSRLNLSSVVTSSVRESTESLLDDTNSNMGITEITFDFHRLNVLLLRGVLKDGFLTGKKICTATMTGAKIQAIISKKLEVEGSLGGLQVLDLTPEGQMHQRIISVGRDPLVETSHPIYTMSMPQANERVAFNFRVIRNLEKCNEKDSAEVTIRMASLWYTHSPQFVMELQSCASEFKQYLSNLARSIRTAATDMALGLVHAKAEALAQTLNKRLPSSIYGSSLSFPECPSPNKRSRRRTSSTTEASGFCSARDTVPQTPYSPEDDDDFAIEVVLDIELDSPVLVLPRTSNSPEVFVAHLGRINVTNYYTDDTSNCHQSEFIDSRIEHYTIEIRDMNLYSLNTASRRGTGQSTSKPEVLYNCKSLAKPILHDTLLQLKILREINKSFSTQCDNDSYILFSDDCNEQKCAEIIDITGSIVTALKISLTRAQYEQLLDTLQWLTSTPVLTEVHGINISNIRPQSALTNISEEDIGVTTLNMDPHVRAKLFPTVTTTIKTKTPVRNVALKISFEVPMFTVELRSETVASEQAVVDLSFRDFIFNYEKSNLYETNIQVSLRSIHMEDLLQPEDSKQRSMVISSDSSALPNSCCVSRSCPDVMYQPHLYCPMHSSLPDHLETRNVFGNNVPGNFNHTNFASPCPCTPPPSPSQGKNNQPEKKLVLISTLLVDPSTPNFEKAYNSIQKSTSIDFNCLDLVINVPSWLVVLDFFSASTSNDKYGLLTNLNVAPEDKSIYVSKNKTVTNVTVCSLTVVLVKPKIDIAKANISNLDIVIKTDGLYKEVEGKLGSMSLLDLTLHGQLYRERFTTVGDQALQFKYIRHPPNAEKNFDAQLTLEMVSVIVVYTKRFVAEIQAFFAKFTKTQQTVIKGIQAATSSQLIRDDPLRLSTFIKVGSPMILIPVSSRSTNLLVIDLGQLMVTNMFKYSGEPGTVSHIQKESSKKCMLEVMNINLEKLDLYTGTKENELNLSPSKYTKNNCFKLGNLFVMRKGPSLLTKKFQLELQYEKNLSKNDSHHVPDSSIYGYLSSLDCAIDLHQYKLIRGLLEFNLGEDTEKIYPTVSVQNPSSENNAVEVWIVTSLKFDMENVALRLLKSHKDWSPITCINFIKSNLTVESYSNFSQDIDLVSQEILIIDTRFHGSENTQDCNVFTNILQPIKDTVKETDLVQVEVHSRKRKNHSKITILLNNMRLMAIFDWWEMFHGFLFQEIESVASSPEHYNLNKVQAQSVNTFELKLNVTNSELVVVEDSSQWDSSAVILKSTTVLKYRPHNREKPLSCSLNSCEMFSCILGNENGTALSIIDPINLYIDINKERTLEVQLQFLTVRLSYHDLCMFSQILNSLPKQLILIKSQKTQVPHLKNNISTLSALGFKTEDCLLALEKCENKLDDAAIWLTHNAAPVDVEVQSNTSVSINAVEVKANCISICIIDDCGDSDVPLLELSFSDLDLSQLLPQINVTNSVYPTGALSCKLTCEYYSRILSGWEPVLEPWRCRILWEKTISQNLLRNRLMVRVESEDTLNLNITSTIIELYKQVKESWTKDYSIKMSSNNDKSVMIDRYRKRTPFIPFALKNDTGSTLSFSTHVSDVNYSSGLTQKSDDNWLTVDPGKTISFSFTTRDKLRHQNTHKMKLHQIIVKVDGWQCVEPVTVDKVGVYFRDTPADRENRALDIPLGRIVFDISLEGSARKLVTVRSALLLTNSLPQMMEIKLESRLPNDMFTLWAPSKVLTIEPKNTLAVPLAHAHSEICIRPHSTQQSLQYTYCMPSLLWAQAPSNVDKIYELATCHSHKGYNYRFCAEISKQKIVTERGNRCEQPAHRITLLPTIKIVNLLPTDMDYTIHDVKGHVEAGSNISITNVNPEISLEIEIKIENFKTCTTVVIPAGGSDFNCQIKLEDNKQRKLYLLAEIKTNEAAKINVSISAPYWIINKTGLPLVFRQSGTSIEAAGQFDEHEQARMVAPLLFSFLDQDACHSVNARVGRKVIWDGTPQWCSNFHLRKGTQYRKLHVTMRDGKSDMVFIVGIEVRSGRGKYRNTHIITISPRYQLYNRSSYQLAFAQACTVNNGDSLCQKACLKAMPNSHMPFHWTKLEKDQLLCVSIEDVPDCHWSGGLRIDTNCSMHVNIRDANSRVYFLRLEVVLQGATFYVVFTDADTLPPPIRVDNFSEVSIKFGQTGYIDIMHSTARAHSSVPYAWDEPTKDQVIRLIAPGGVSHSYNINILGPAAGLTYENFIYIAFIATFKNTHGMRDPCDVESQELVLDVRKNKVILAQKIPGERSQLWRMTSEGHLQHEGSSPPSHPGMSRSKENILVLDIENTAPQPNNLCRLILRRIDPRRQSTQKWRFTEEGRLCCDHYNMCVQPEDGFYGLRPGSAAVLGLPQPVCHKVTDTGIPIEQAIDRQRFRPGSGFLSVTITMDGPTQVVTIKDVKEKKMYASPDSREWGMISFDNRPNLRSEDDKVSVDNKEFQFTLSLRGLGLSLVCMRNQEELLYASFSEIIGETVLTSQNKQFCVSVRDVQIDNQLLDATVPVVNYVTPPNSRTNNDAEDLLPAIDFNAEMLPKLNEKAILFKHLILRLKKMTVIIEEKLLLKLFAFIGFHFQEEELVTRDETDYETQRLLTEVSAAHAKRYYFGVLKLIPDQISLSVKTASKLTKELQKMKRMLGLTLIQFEDAAIDLEPFDRKHPFETSQFLYKSIVKHFKEGLMWQAGFILFSVDFIGSPRGLVNDVSEGFSGLIREGNVRDLVKNVAHGLSNSTAKLTESISDGLGRISMDDYHEEMRHKIRQVEGGRSSDHLLAGMKGLGFGVLGGATGIFKQVYEGVSSDGLPGFASGFGKGVLGFFTKPVVGVLDLASETARALRDSSRSKHIPERKRLPRCIQGPGGVLPRYSTKQSQGQQFLYSVNQKNYDEKLVAYQILGSASEDLLCIVSNKIIRIVTSTKAPELTTIIECPLSDLEVCNSIMEKESGDPRYYIEIVMRYAGVSAALVNTDPIKRPRVRCKTSELASTVAQQINYAKKLYVEELYTLSDDKVAVLED